MILTLNVLLSGDLLIAKEVYLYRKYPPYYHGLIKDNIFVLSWCIVLGCTSHNITFATSLWKLCILSKGWLGNLKDLRDIITGNK